MFSLKPVIGFARAPRALTGMRGYFQKCLDMPRLSNPFRPKPNSA